MGWLHLRKVCAQRFIQGEFIARSTKRFRIYSSRAGDALAAIPQLTCWSGTTRQFKPVAAADWTERAQAASRLMQAKMTAAITDDRCRSCRFGGGASTRTQPVQLAGRGRLLITRGLSRVFTIVTASWRVRDVARGSVRGNWNPAAWRTHLESELPTFSELFEKKNLRMIQLNANRFTASTSAKPQCYLKN